MMVRSSAIVKSLVFHVAVVGMFVVSFPFLSRDIAPEQPILTVDIVKTTPETNLDEGIETQSDSEASQADADDAPPPPPPPTPPAPPPPATPAPEIAEAVPTPSVNPKPAKTPDTKPQPVAAPPKRPTQHSPEFKKRQQEQALLTSKLQDLTERQAKLKKEDQEKKDKEAAERKEAQDKLDQIVGQALNTPRRTSSSLGVAQIDLLRNHIATCWNPPPGASSADALIVDIIVRLNRHDDKSADVEEVEIVDKAKMRSDGTFRAAALAARRALIECSPLPLPLGKGETQRELQFEFNPRFITRS